METECYKLVNKFVTDNAKFFIQDKFASQWGNIRKIAMQYKGKNRLNEKLFDIHEGYLMHGVAKDKWSEMGRIKKFKEFFDLLNDKNANLVLVNLASEMSKRIQANKKKNKK